MKEMSAVGNTVSWCQVPEDWARQERRRRLGTTILEEAPGYVAAVAFVAAYGLMVAGAAPMVQGLLNLAGSGLAASYFWRKRAMPNVLLNVAWAFITIIGLVTLR